MRTFVICAALALAVPSAPSARQNTAKTLVAVFAHPDDESSAAPILARYAREGVQVHLIVATDGAAGGQQTPVPAGPELAKMRAGEVRCAADALGIKPPILLDFPDGKLGAYGEDPLRLFRLTARVHQELQRLHPDALITWGPDGGTGHPDHRLISAVVTQLVRTSAPGVPERLFYVTIPAEVMRALNPSRPEPPLLIPQAKLLTTKIVVTPPDLEAAGRSLGCHKSQFPPDAVARLGDAGKQLWTGGVPVSPAFASASSDDLFR
jgi:LmbE family N-acetylglucosaminyl deacetylase